MASYRKQLAFDVPITVIEGKILELNYRWKILSQESGHIVIEERTNSGDGPYDPKTFIGTTQMEIDFITVSSGSKVTLEATNEYYGSDPLPSEISDVSNGHCRALRDLELDVDVFFMQLEDKAKSWAAQQRYLLVQEQKRLPKPKSPRGLATKSSDKSDSSSTSGFKPEQLSIEDFVSKLERLAMLQRSGALTNAEFEQAKLRLLRATE